MNDPTKTIDVDKSSLLSLKAELLRKQEEVSRANINRRLIPQLKTKIKAMKSIEPQNLRQGEYLEDVALINKSKKTLEAKAKFYDKMVSGERTIGENCLVNFEQKRLEARELSDDEDLPSCSKTALDQNLWVEYTDSLGRSRVCLKKDLSSFVQQDKDLNVVSFPAEKDKKVTLSKTINLKPVIDVGLKFQVF